MVADEVDDRQPLLAGGGAQAAAELLEEDHGRLGGAQHQHAVHAGQVDALVEHVDRADDLQLAVAEAVERFGPGCGGGARVDGCGGDALLVEEGGHVVGVGDRAAEGEGACGAPGPPLVERLVRPLAGLDRTGERLGVEAAVAPGDGLEIGDVAHAPVAERHEVALADAGDQVAVEHQVVAAEAEQVGAVHAFGGGGEAQQEPGREVGDDLAVGGGGGVVELVDDHVVELGGVELVEAA